MKKVVPILLAVASLPASGAIILDAEEQLLGTIIKLDPLRIINAPNVLDFDVNQDGEIDFGVVRRINPFGSAEIAITDARGLSRFVFSLEYLSALEEGFDVGPNLSTPTRQLENVVEGPGGPLIAATVQGIRYGEFTTGLTSYLGFEFQADTGTHYGYLQIADQGPNGLIIERTAWETTPGKSILTGAIPEPTTPAFLAVVGILGLARRSRAD